MFSLDKIEQSPYTTCLFEKSDHLVFSCQHFFRLLCALVFSPCSVRWVALALFRHVLLALLRHRVACLPVCLSVCTLVLCALRVLPKKRDGHRHHHSPNFLLVSAGLRSLRA